jgi:PQQ-dependent catabolism-associated CXXCW motif protein
MSGMRAAFRAVAGLAAAVFLAAAAPEPDGLWTGPMIGDTPATLAGAKVLDVEGLEKLMAEKPLLIDSGPADKKPETLPPTAIWRPTHRSIPGAAWFPGAGRGDLDPARTDALIRRIGELSGGKMSKPIVTFCQPRCWGSWNVGKRLVKAGYTAVYWFPAGIDGWQERGDTSLVEPQPGWKP